MQENTETNEVIEVESIENQSTFEVAKDINLMLTVLVFAVIVFQLYKLLKNCLPMRK